MNRLDSCVVHTLVGEEGVWDGFRSPEYYEQCGDIQGG